MLFLFNLVMFTIFYLILDYCFVTNGKPTINRVLNSLILIFGVFLMTVFDRFSLLTLVLSFYTLTHGNLELRKSKENLDIDFYKKIMKFSVIVFLVSLVLMVIGL